MGRRRRLCSVPNCGSVNEKGNSFFKFPPDPKRRRRWEECVGLGKPASHSNRVCSEHFAPQDFFPRNKEGPRNLKLFAVPSRKLPDVEGFSHSDCSKSMSSRSEIDVDILIEKVASQRPIWDMQLPAYSIREVVDDCWKTISREMGNPEFKLRKKWKYLRDQFCVELGKIQAGGETKWIKYNNLSFLCGVVKPRMARQTHRDSADDDEDSSVTNDDVKSYQMNSGADEQADPLADPLADLSDGHWSGEPRKRMADGGLKTDSRLATSDFPTEATSATDSKVGLSELILKNNQTDNEAENDDMLFFRSLLPYISKIPPHKKMRFRSKILQVVDDFVYATDTPGCDSAVKLDANT